MGTLRLPRPASGSPGHPTTIVLPGRGKQHDCGARTRRVDRAAPPSRAPRPGTRPVAATRSHTPRSCSAPIFPGIGTDWLASRTPHVFPTGPYLVPPRSSTPPPAGMPAAQRRGDAGRTDQRHDLRRGPAHRTHLGDHRTAARRPADDRHPPATAPTTARFCNPVTSIEGEITGLGTHATLCGGRESVPPDGDRRPRVIAWPPKPVSSRRGLSFNKEVRTVPLSGWVSAEFNRGRTAFAETCPYLLSWRESPLRRT